MFNLEATPSRGKICYAGNKFALIRGNGDVVRCGQAKPEDVMGNFLANNFFLNKYASTCTYDFCPCNDYSPVSSEDSARLLKDYVDIPNGEGELECAGYLEKCDSVVPLGEDKKLVCFNESDSNEVLQQEEDNARLTAHSEVSAKSTPVEFSWEICYTCNYRCPYCGRWNDASNADIYLDVLEWERIWTGIYEKYGSCNMFISGAEPTTYPGFFEIVKKIAAMHTVTICTNFSWSVEEILQRDFNPLRVKVTPTFHSLFADFEGFLAKAVRLRQWIKDNMVFFVAHPAQMDNASYYKNRMNENGFNFCIVPLRGNKEGNFGVLSNEDDKDKISLITDMSEDEYVYLAEKISPKGKLCLAGHHYAFIKATGDIFACSQSDLFLGNIQNKEFALLNEPMACSSDFCPYESYNLLERHKMPNER